MSDAEDTRTPANELARLAPAGHDALVDPAAQDQLARATTAAAEADRVWREAIRTALAHGAMVAAVAECSKASRSLVSQLRDGRREPEGPGNLRRQADALNALVAATAERTLTRQKADSLKRLTPEELADLERLRPRAASRNGRNRHDPRVAEDSAAFNAILMRARARGVSDYSMAKALGVTRPAITSRLQRAATVATPATGPRQLEPDDALLLARLRHLLPLAKAASGYSHGPLHEASVEFGDILLDLERRNVSSPALARALGEDLRSLKARRDRARQRVIKQANAAARGLDEDRSPVSAADQPLIDRLRQLAPLSRRAAGHSSGPLHEASREFDRILLELVDSRQLSASTINRALGRTTDRDRRTLSKRVQDARSRLAPPASETTPLPAPSTPQPASVPPGDRHDTLPAGHRRRGRSQVLTGGQPVAVARRGLTGCLVDFSPETTPSAPSTSAAPAFVDPELRDQRTAEHHQATRRLREAARARGLQTRVWGVGQDAAFIWDGRLVIIEVKTAREPTALEQYRLGYGQVKEYLQRHLDNSEAGEPWYHHAGVHTVLPMLVLVPAQKILEPYPSTARREQMPILDIDAALHMITTADSADVPPGVSLPAPITEGRRWLNGVRGEPRDVID